jgi:hypothetical protein
MMFEWDDALLGLLVYIIVVGVLVAIFLIIAIGGLLARMFCKRPDVPMPRFGAAKPSTAQAWQFIPKQDEAWLAGVLERLPEA